MKREVFQQRQHKGMPDTSSSTLTPTDETLQSSPTHVSARQVPARCTLTPRTETPRNFWRLHSPLRLFWVAIPAGWHVQQRLTKACWRLEKSRIPADVKNGSAFHARGSVLNVDTLVADVTLVPRWLIARCLPGFASTAGVFVNHPGYPTLIAAVHVVIQFDWPTVEQCPHCV